MYIVNKLKKALMTDEWLIYSPSHVSPHLLEDEMSMYACTLLGSWISQCWSPFQTDIHCMHCVCLRSRLNILAALQITNYTKPISTHLTIPCTSLDCIYNT